MPRAWYDANTSSGLLEPTDEELLTAWRRGDMSAMRILVARHMATVRGPLSWLIEDTEECEDTVVDVFTSLVQSDEPMFPASSLSVALTRHAVLAGDAWRRSHAAERAQQAQSLRRGATAQGGPRPQEVVAALAELPTDFFVPLMLRHLENRGISEIAEVCEKTERQVWTAIHQALATVDRVIRGAPPTTRKPSGPSCDEVAILMMLENELPARERDRVAAHVARCGDCRAHEWRLSTLLAFLGSIAGMKRRRDDPAATLERVAERARARPPRARTSLVLRRAATVMVAMAAVALVILIVAAIAPRLSSPETPAPVAAPDREPESPATESESPSPMGQSVETAWLPLPEFAGDPSGPPTAGPRPAQAGPVTGREAVAEPEAAVPPAAPTPPSTAAGTSMPTRAGWSRNAARPRAGQRQPGGGSAPAETSAAESRSPGRAAVVVPGPPGFSPPQPVLPRIVRGSQATGTTPQSPTAPPTTGGEGTQPAGAESSDGARSTLAEVVSLLSGYTKPKTSPP